jgi:hypothetical protein
VQKDCKSSAVKHFALGLHRAGGSSSQTSCCAGITPSAPDMNQVMIGAAQETVTNPALLHSDVFFHLTSLKSRTTVITFMGNSISVDPDLAS